MAIDRYRYLVEIYSTSGTPLGQSPIWVDWDPARESAAFAAFRRRPGQRAMALGSAASIQPRWHPELRSPYIDGFRVAVIDNGGAEFSVDFRNVYFKELAQVAAGQLVKNGRLSAGDRFYYCVLAFPANTPERNQPAPAFVAEEVSVGVPVKTGELRRFLDSSLSFKPDSDGDMPVFIPQNVLSEVATLSRQADGTETGGVLIGSLFRDSSDGDLFLVVTAQIPATHTRAEATRLTFTAEAWTAVDDAIKLRGTDEIKVGWHHSHPVAAWCRECPPEKRRTCTRFQDVFSPEDEAFHRTVFPRAWSIALLVSDLPDRGPSISLHGWRQGLVEPRGFHVLESPPPFVR